MRDTYQKIITDFKIKNKLEYKKTSYQLRKILSPITHSKLNDEFKLNSVDEIPIFFDIFHDKRAEETVDKLMSGMNSKEFELLKKILNKLIEFNNLCENKSLPYNSILRHFYQYRLLSKLLPNCRSLLEIGPGSGFLPLISVMSNDEINYICTDISEAYFLTQEILYNYFNLLDEERHHLKKGKILHLPWWEYINLIKKNLKIDCIIINHAICEMHEDAIKFLLKTSLNLDNKFFFLEGKGYDKFFSFKNVKKLFRVYGYKLIYEKNDVYIFENKKNFKKNNDKIEKLSDYPFLRILIKEFEFFFKKINEKINHQNKSIFKESDYKIEEINKFYQKIYTEKKIQSLSESFFNMIKAK